MKVGDRALQRRYWKQGDGGTSLRAFRALPPLSLEEWRPQSLDTWKGSRVTEGKLRIAIAGPAKQAFDETNLIGGFDERPRPETPWL